MIDCWNHNGVFNILYTFYYIYMDVLNSDSDKNKKEYHKTTFRYSPGGEIKIGLIRSNMLNKNAYTFTVFLLLNISFIFWNSIF